MPTLVSPPPTSESQSQSPHSPLTSFLHRLRPRSHSRSTASPPSPLPDEKYTPYRPPLEPTHAQQRYSIAPAGIGESPSVPRRATDRRTGGWKAAGTGGHRKSLSSGAAEQAVSPPPAATTTAMGSEQHVYHYRRARRPTLGRRDLGPSPLFPAQNHPDPFAAGPRSAPLHAHASSSTPNLLFPAPARRTHTPTSPATSNSSSNLIPKSFEPASVCDAFLFPRPRLRPHAITPPSPTSPSYAFPPPPPAPQPQGTIRKTRSETFSHLVPVSPVTPRENETDLERVLREGAELERERARWRDTTARSITGSAPRRRRSSSAAHSQATQTQTQTHSRTSSRSTSTRRRPSLPSLFRRPSADAPPPPPPPPLPTSAAARTTRSRSASTPLYAPADPSPPLPACGSFAGLIPPPGNGHNRPGTGTVLEEGESSFPRLSLSGSSAGRGRKDSGASGKRGRRSGDQNEEEDLDPVTVIGLRPGEGPSPERRIRGVESNPVLRTSFLSTNSTTITTTHAQPQPPPTSSPHPAGAALSAVPIPSMPNLSALAARHRLPPSAAGAARRFVLPSYAPPPPPQPTSALAARPSTELVIARARRLADERARENVRTLLGGAGGARRKPVPEWVGAVESGSGSEGKGIRAEKGGADSLSPPLGSSDNSSRRRVSPSSSVMQPDTDVEDEDPDNPLSYSNLFFAPSPDHAHTPGRRERAQTLPTTPSAASTRSSASDMDDRRSPLLFGLRHGALECTRRNNVLVTPPTDEGPGAGQDGDDGERGLLLPPPGLLTPHNHPPSYFSPVSTPASEAITPIRILNSYFSSSPDTQGRIGTVDSQLPSLVPSPSPSEISDTDREIYFGRKRSYIAEPLSSPQHTEFSYAAPSSTLEGARAGLLSPFPPTASGAVYAHPDRTASAESRHTGLSNASSAFALFPAHTDFPRPPIVDFSPSEPQLPAPRRKRSQSFPEASTEPSNLNLLDTPPRAQGARLSWQTPSRKSSYATVVSTTEGYATAPEEQEQELFTPSPADSEEVLRGGVLVDPLESGYVDEEEAAGGNRMSGYFGLPLPRERRRVDSDATMRL